VFQTAPEQRVVVLVAATVSLQTLVDVMDMVYASGGKNVFVKEWDVQYAPEGPAA
jgi:biopolymer transport protein ExbD